MKRNLLPVLAATIGVVALTGCASDVSGFDRFSVTRRAHPMLEMGPIPGGVGVNIHFYEGNENDWRMLTEAGCGIVRMDVSWAGCEKTPGQYDFSHYDALISRLEKHNIRLLFIIDYGNPLYDNGLAPHSDACRQAYARFVSALVARYRGKAIIWELWNEPNIGFWKPKPNVDDYMAWCKAVVPAIRQADPNACVIAPATSGIPLAFMEQCFKQGLLELVDGVSVHPYRGAKSGPETAIREYKRLARLIEQYTPESDRTSNQQRRRIPILSGEWGYSSAHMSRGQQGKYLPRQWLANTVSGLPISIWYDWHDDGKDPKENEHNFGTVTWDYKPKPAYVAMKTLIEQLGGYYILDRIDVGSEQDFVVLAVKFGETSQGDRTRLAVWTTGEPHDIEVGPGLKILDAVDHLGRTIHVPSGSRLPATDAPCYLTPAQALPAWLCPMRLHTARGYSAGAETRYQILACLHNPTNRPATVMFDSIRAGDVYVTGKWLFGGKHRILAGTSCVDVLRIDVCRRDAGTILATVSARVTPDGEASHVVSRTADLCVVDPVSMDLAWRQDGLQVTISTKGERPLKGRLIPRVDGVDRRAVGVALDPPGKTAVVRWDDIRVAGAPRHVGVRLVNRYGRTLAEIEPMTYALVDTIDGPVGADAGQRYRLWHEGDPQRKAELSGVIVRAPGGDPPFPRAVRVDYDMAAGWCFWQLGPKDTPQMYPARPRRIMLWVRGEACDDWVRCRVVDKAGQTFQPTAGKLDVEGWRPMVMSLEDGMGHWGGPDDGVIRPPLCWVSYYLQDSTKAAHAGTTYLTGVVVAW